MARRKSINQINAQLNRIREAAYGRLTEQGFRRVERANGIANRYRDNIARANGYSGYRDPRVFSGLTGLSDVGRNLSAPRNVYMGINVG